MTKRLAIICKDIQYFIRNKTVSKWSKTYEIFNNLNEPMYSQNLVQFGPRILKTIRRFGRRKCVNSAANYCSISLRFGSGTEFDHTTPDILQLQTFKVKGSKVKVTA